LKLKQPKQDTQATMTTALSMSAMMLSTIPAVAMELGFCFRAIIPRIKPTTAAGMPIAQDAQIPSIETIPSTKEAMANPFESLRPTFSSLVELLLTRE